MAWRLLVLLAVGCTATRELARVDDLRLRTPHHDGGFVVATTERWRERIDPNTVVRLRGRDGAWSDALVGRDLYVDAAGAWVDRAEAIGHVADAIAIDHAPAELVLALVATRPSDGTLEQAGGSVAMRAPSTALVTWLGDVELELARRIPLVDAQPDAAWRSLPLGTWHVRARDGRELATLQGDALIAALRSGITVREGWTWDRVEAVEVENVSGARTLGGLFVGGLLAISLAPLQLAAGREGGWIPSGGGGTAGTRAHWNAELPDHAVTDAQRMFSTAARVHAVVRPTVTLDGAAALAGDQLTSGAIARLRLVDVVELGGGVRVAEIDRGGMWSRSTTGVFTVGLHLPLDAAQRFAIPLGFEIGGGGAVRDDLRFPVGLRVSTASQRWFATVLPATPAYLRLHDAPHGRWSVLGGVELGATF